MLEKFWYVKVYRDELNINIFRRGCTRNSRGFIFNELYISSINLAF